ncbi:MAG: hypothetical protein A3H62_00495 [Candidatus Ryanbacteria bacterium RIFCSPLOWO2_02_FULL_44_40]|uniref:Uncharacterized protein n=1 Tax=Candidatus Ryanbacteria bacterium RIFCSPHIGHO2_01_45_13 TaxID=1802112 RepID=A0A1G2FXZ5_9BACT|nr:MAG: hypothetical protein A2W41_03870 [Candidatus Ryanbacteria bacterium RIFCSPHIGHO2_01_45_13]OGZ54649.1 MAG: hypothetical protein A3H62_00495 [Candidatus Ryanbacteria bacterium RIFCSPLOWO2_02_FULL_44_40]
MAWKYSHAYFLAKSTLRVLGKRIDIVFALHKSHRQREFALWRVFKPVAREFEARKVSDVEKIDYLSAVHRIARQTIGVPTDNPRHFTFLNTPHHFAKNGTTWNFSSTLFHKLLHDF